MNILLICLASLLSSSLALLIYFIIRYKKILNGHLEDFQKQYDKKHEELVEREKATLAVWEQKIEFYETRAQDALKHSEEMRRQAQKSVDDQLILYEEKERQKIQQKINKLQTDYDLRKKELEEKFKKFEDDINIDISAMKEVLEEYQQKYLAVQEEERKKLLLEKEKDAHRLILTDFEKNDIGFLISIVNRLRHPEILYKLIWSEFLQKPFQQMIKQLFGSDIPKNVIYCIENLNTHQKYIGKTAGEVSKRWSEHIKTSLTIGGVSRSKIHDELYMHWDEFMFSVVEIVENEKLSEREKFYINLYQSNIYGYNIKG